MIFAGGIDTNVFNFSHHILEGVGALNMDKGTDPNQAVKPFDKNRRGTVQADGGSLLVLESEESVKRRGAKPIAEIVGYQTNSFADHIYLPNQQGI